MKGLTGEFVWRVPDGGFRWQKGIHRRPAARFSRGGVSFVSFHGPVENDLAFFDSPSDFLIPNGPENDRLPSGLTYHDTKDALSFVISGSKAREYRPLSDCPALFRELADIDPSPEGFLAFADRWGALGSEATCSIVRVEDDGSEIVPNSPIWGEVIGIWELESGYLHDAVALWDAARHGLSDILKASIWFDGDTVCWHSVPDGWSFTGEDWVSAPDHHPERYDQIKRYGLARAAQYIVQDLVNEGLRARVHEQLQWDDLTHRPAIRIVPINLIGALWLQFASAIDSDHDYAQCTECSRWFEIAPGSGRPDKRYCSDACRMRAYRKRKAKK